ncbi:MAG: VWA domain-containing protein [Polyangiaceae bacterium]|nr:VWA domain-containing protein [Polyangiaceae bacterium]
MAIRVLVPCSVLALLVVAGCGNSQPEEQSAALVRLACSKADETGQVSGALSVVDKKGDPVSISKDDATVGVETRAGDGPWKTIKDVQHGFNGPAQLDVVLVVDNSGSEIDELERIQETARDFARKLEVRAHRDRVALVRVSTVAKVLTPLTEDLDAFDAAVASLFVRNGWTALWDGIRVANEILAEDALGQVKGADGEICLGRTYRAIVAFTDGRENNSADEHETSYPGDGVDTTLDMLAEQEVLGARTPLHLVGIGPKVDPETLSGLADKTQGYYAAIDDFNSLHGKLMSAAARLDGQIPVCFVPNDCADTQARISVTLASDPAATPLVAELPLPDEWCAVVADNGKSKK